MHRTPFVLTATAAGLAGVLSYHSSGRSFGSLHPAAVASGSHRASASPQASTGTGTGTGAQTLPPPPGAGRTDTGPLIQYGYGELAVQVTMSGSRITSVSAKGLQTDSQYSQSLALQVIPLLRSEVLQAQSANINGITGASYTSQAFAISLRSALSHLKA